MPRKHSEGAHNTKERKQKVKRPWTRQRKIKTAFITLVSILGILVLAVGCGYLYLNQMYNNDLPFVAWENDPHPTEDPNMVPIDTTTPEPTLPSDLGVDDDTLTAGVKMPIMRREQKDHNIRNVLLLGTDDRTNTMQGQTDAVMILSYNQQTGKATLTSIMRDSWVPLKGKNMFERINAANVIGGPGLVINTVNDIFDLDIQHYAMINFDGLVMLVDNLGGIELTLTASEAEWINDHPDNRSKTRLKETAGTQVLNGWQALSHSRNRTLGNSDYSRTERQRNVLTAILNKVLGKGLSGATSFINFATSHVTTNMKPLELIGMGTQVLKTGTFTLVQQRIPFDGMYEDVRINNKAVLRLDLEKNKQKLQAAIYTY